MLCPMSDIVSYDRLEHGPVGDCFRIGKINVIGNSECAGIIVGVCPSRPCILRTIMNGQLALRSLGEFHMHRTFAVLTATKFERRSAAGNSATPIGACHCCDQHAPKDARTITLREAGTPTLPLREMLLPFQASSLHRESQRNSYSLYYPGPRPPAYDNSLLHISIYLPYCVSS
jgi:hypothetical protein